MSAPFHFAPTPDIHFGSGKLSMLPSIIAKYGRHVLIVTGQRSFMASPHWARLQEGLHQHGILFHVYKVEKEPTPDLIDRCTQQQFGKPIEVVVAIGGGSVLDAGKAISAMLPLGEPVRLYLEGIGIQEHSGKKLPFIAVPTTAGTGSEATKNAVLSEVGPGGFKKSLRHPQFVPNVALLDPELTLHCPKSITAASGMDAFTQLLESFLATQENPLTDSLAKEGLRLVANSLLPCYDHGQTDIESRSRLLMASHLSGITLANAGLGVVHGFASSIGGFYEIPHGVICSTLMHPANVVTVRKLRAEKSNAAAMEKYAEAGRIITQQTGKSSDYYTDALLETIAQWSDYLQLPKLSTFDVKQEEIAHIVAVTDNKSNPAKLTQDEMAEVLLLAF